jgi:hypothetical protein
MPKEVQPCRDCSEPFINYGGYVRCEDCRTRRRPYVSQDCVPEASRRGVNKRTSNGLEHPPDTYLPNLLVRNFRARVQTGEGRRAKDCTPFPLSGFRVIRRWVCLMTKQMED